MVNVKSAVGFREHVWSGEHVGGIELTSALRSR